MTPDEVIAEYHHVIAEYDSLHAPCPIEQRQRQREAERQQRREQEVRKIENQALTQAQLDSWSEQLNSWFEQKLNATLGDKEKCAFIKAVGQCLGETRAQLRQDYTAKIAALETRLKDLEQQQSLEAKFFEMERRLDARQLARDEAERGSEMIPQSELLPEIEKLQRQVDDLMVADQDARFRELAERLSELEKTNSLEARFTKLADEAKRGSEMIPQSQLLPEIEKLQRQVGDLKRVADPDARFRELSERVGELEKTYGLEARFATLANKVKQESAIPQDELLAKFEGLQRQVDELKSVADLDSGFCELTERVSALEQTRSLEARFTELAHEVKHRSELPQSELLARIDGLQRQLDDLKKVTGQTGPQGPPGPPGKLPLVREYVSDHVHYERDVVTHAGALWQARSDTAHAPPHSDWTCLARAGRDGSDGRSPSVCGTYDAREKYKRLDIIALDGGAFIAGRDNPGICPGDGWQLLCRQGRPGHRGESGARGPRGETGERGEPGATVVSWQLDRQRYRVSPLMSDGKVGPMLELRGLFEQFQFETS